MQTGNPNLDFYLDKNVSELITLDRREISPELEERHHLYSLLLMAITHFYWNSNKDGKDVDYKLDPTSKLYKNKKNDYLGHNIAAIAVDANGEIIDFEFNHNTIFNSSMEHAEARLVRRIYNLIKINDSWNVSLTNNNPTKSYATLDDVTIYTTLESCAQCSGIMALARVKEVVYLQTDPGMYLIGNIIRNLTKKIVGNDGKLESPIPINAIEFNFLYTENLNTAYKKFKEKMKNKIGDPFYIDPKTKTNYYTESISSFLCTKFAFDIYTKAYKEFNEQKNGKIDLDYADFKPNTNAKTNLEVIEEVNRFYTYATEKGKRGTPH